MKYILLFLGCCCAILCSAQKNWVGAWTTTIEGNTATMICSEGFFAVAIYHAAEKKFIGTYGGKYSLNNNEVTLLEEFNTLDQNKINVPQKLKGAIKDKELTMIAGTSEQRWKRVDDGTPSQIAGAWLITGRNVNNEMLSITPTARKTMKILSGNHFQWIAYNADTKDFFGTGGGTYTTENGKYAETLFFFSRDNNRVGTTLQFNFAMEDGKWIHSGKSSKGDPIHEVWTRREQLGL
jgi:hypothetical protein